MLNLKPIEKDQHLFDWFSTYILVMTDGFFDHQELEASV